MSDIGEKKPIEMWPDPRTGEVRLTVPLHITLRLGDPVPSPPHDGSLSGEDKTARGAGLSLDLAEAFTLKEPFIERNYDGRAGFRTDFLDIPVPLPEVTDPHAASRRLDGNGPVLTYEHFSVVIHKERRLALFTASNVDGREGSRKPDPSKTYTRAALTGLTGTEIEKWATDPRIPAGDQLPDRFYSEDRGAFDKGHIVRRDDVCFGTSYDQVRRANGDTYHVTNCSPQVKGYNQSPKGADNWGDLENFVLKSAASETYSLFAGPVLDPSDRRFRGKDDQGEVRVKIPRSFWKVVMAPKGGELQAFAFLLEQNLSDVPLEAFLREAEFEESLDPRTLEFLPTPEWRRKMISIPDLENRLGRLLHFPEVVRQADQFSTPEGEELLRWNRLERYVG